MESPSDQSVAMVSQESNEVGLACGADTVLNYSSLCVGSHVRRPADCYPYNPVTDAVTLANLASGLVGNALTLSATPYAMHRKRFALYYQLREGSHPAATAPPLGSASAGTPRRPPCSS